MKLQELDFQEIKILFCDVDGVMTGGTTEYASDGTKSKSFNHRDGVGVSLLAGFGIQVVVLSQSKDQAIIQGRCQDIGIESFFCGVEDKKEMGKRILSDRGMSYDNAAYIGDDLPDVPLLSSCKLSFSPSDAHLSAKEIVTKILSSRGGEGCIREIADLMMFSVK